jgi:hypothetical protein
MKAKIRQRLFKTPHVETLHLATSADDATLHPSPRLLAVQRGIPRPVIPGQGSEGEGRRERKPSPVPEPGALTDPPR